ncbi:MAG TPA: sodium:proton antiporter [Bacteroidia bacterium]|nr:sodium:proton antiporter [Bacteroidia bacterium]
MNLFILFSVLISLAAVFSYINVRSLQLPSGIALMLLGSALSVVLLVAGRVSPAFTGYIRAQLSVIDFSEFLLGILLSFLLFAGSLHVNMQLLKESAKSVIAFSTLGVVVSTLLTGTVLYFLLKISGLETPFVLCLLFGSLISPTDPIAVMGILKKSGVPKPVEIMITGESLFNDGIGVVIFATIMQSASGGAGVSFGSVAWLFAQEAAGGILTGLLIGYAGYRLMKSIDHFQTEILISLAMVMGGYSLCHFIHVSGPLAMVVAGLVTGNKGVTEAMSDITRDYLEKFWEVMDEILNAILFTLIGLELIVVSFRTEYMIIGTVIAVVLVFIRYISIWIPASLFFFREKLGRKTMKIMTWGGLRGGISVALALSVPENEHKDALVAFTFVVVLFSIAVQGMTIERLVKKLNPEKI